ncbi:MAG: TrbM/KikA/MpfK family conjugal transfer protein [Sedimenticola sp.]
MKKMFSIFILSASLSFSPVISAMSISDLACGAILCLSGESDGDGCGPYLDKYYSIVKKKSWGRYCSGCTKAARKIFLSNCEYVGDAEIEAANNKHGSRKYKPSAP